MALVEDAVPATSLNGTNGYSHLPSAQKLSDLKVATTATATEVISSPQEEPATEKQASTRPRFELEEHPVDQVRDIKVGVIGAGLSGVIAGVLLPAKVPGLDLRIYDKNPDVVCCPVSEDSL